MVPESLIQNPKVSVLMEKSPAKVTLGELADIALGSPIITKESLCVLQILLVSLLKKLGCQDEIVRISGFQGQQLQEMLKKSQDNTVDVKYENTEYFEKKMDLLEHLEKKSTIMSNKLDKHFSDVAKLSANVDYSPMIWDIYAKPTEDLCTLYMAHNEAFCKMATNPTLILQLRRRVAYPVLKRINAVELHVQLMTDKIKYMRSKSKEINDRMQILGPMINEIESKRKEIDKQWKEVQEAVTEIQEMSNSKLDRLALRSMRKHLETQFADVKSQLAAFMKNESESPTTNKIELEEGDCLSCSRHKTTPEHIDFKIPFDVTCYCDPPKTDLDLLQKMKKIRVRSYRVTPLTRKHRQTMVVAKTLGAQGHYVHTYTTDEELKDMTMKQIITVAENMGANITRRSTSFSFTRALTFMTQSISTSRITPHRPTTENIPKQNVQSSSKRISLMGDYNHNESSNDKMPKTVTLQSVLKKPSVVTKTKIMFEDK